MVGTDSLVDFLLMFPRRGEGMWRNEVIMEMEMDIYLVDEKQLESSSIVEMPRLWEVFSTPVLEGNVLEKVHPDTGVFEAKMLSNSLDQRWQT